MLCSLKHTNISFDAAIGDNCLVPQFTPSSCTDSITDINTLQAFGSPMPAIHLTDAPMPSMPSLAASVGSGGRAGNLQPTPTPAPGAEPTMIPSLGNNPDNSPHVAQHSGAHRQGNCGHKPQLDPPSRVQSLEEYEEAPVSPTCLTRAWILIEIY